LLDEVSAIEYSNIRMWWYACLKFWQVHINSTLWKCSLESYNCFQSSKKNEWYPTGFSSLYLRDDVQWHLFSYYTKNLSFSRTHPIANNPEKIVSS